MTARRRTAPSPAPLPVRPARMVTMADIAERVGVSKMTVSRAPTRTERRDRATSEDLRQRILMACREMGCVIDKTARTFSTRRSGFIAAVIPSLNNSNFSETAEGITQAVDAAGLQLLLGHSSYSRESEERLIRELLARRPEGMILNGGNHTDAARAMLEASGVPVVERWNLPERAIGHVVGVSNAEAMAEPVRHLHGRGCRRIAFVGGTSNRDTRGADRRRGYTKAIHALGRPEGRVISFRRPPISMNQGAQAIAQLVQQWPDVDAVVCVSNLSAFGALAECQRRGWDVPGRIAIAGFGDFEVGRSCHPRITTVSVGCVGIGRAAGELRPLRAIEAGPAGRPLPPETMLMPFRIGPRESS